MNLPVVLRRLAQAENVPNLLPLRFFSTTPYSGTIRGMSILTAEVEVLDRLLEPVRDCLTPEAAARIVALRADPAAQARLDLLAEKNAEGTITPEKRAVYEAYVRAGTLIGILQAKARAVLTPSPTP